MRDDCKVGDHVAWNSEAGMVTGTIIKKITSAIPFKGYTVHAWEDEPQYLIKSDKTDQKLPFSSRLLSACGATPGHVSVLLERSAWECSGSMRKNKETCER